MLPPKAQESVQEIQKMLRLIGWWLTAFEVGFTVVAVGLEVRRIICDVTDLLLFKGKKNGLKKIVTD